MSNDPLANCGNTDSPESILKQLVRDADCNPYSDCDNKDESALSILKRAVSVDDEGNLVLNLCGCCEGGRTILSETDTILISNSIAETEIYNMTVPGNTLIGDAFAEGMVKGLFFNDSGSARVPVVRIYFGSSLCVHSNLYSMGDANQNYIGFEFHYTIYPFNQANNAQLITGTYCVMDGTAGNVGYQNLINSNKHTNFLGQGAEDATADHNVRITIQLPTASASLYCISHFREIEY